MFTTFDDLLTMPQQTSTLPSVTRTAAVARPVRTAADLTAAEVQLRARDALPDRAHCASVPPSTRRHRHVRRGYSNSKSGGLLVRELRHASCEQRLDIVELRSLGKKRKRSDMITETLVKKTMTLASCSNLHVLTITYDMGVATTERWERAPHQRPGSF